jgi:hypothetical protein
MKVSYAALGFEHASLTVSKARQARKTRTRAIINHIESAKSRKSGTDITSFSPDELQADLRRHRVRG